ncbi:RNA 2',3'-cyclic phosphodiesterase [Pelomyxa schiedti]|nr:RNA 2',3'-cyclic phosphodiesterase [Pelomyxa schiedti]
MSGRGRRGGSHVGDEAKSNLCAVVALLPESMYHRVQHLRAVHDKSFERWPPHINLLYPFVNVEDIPTAVPKLAAAVATTSPFEVCLENFSYFPHKNSFTMWLDPKPHKEVISLQARLENAIPICNDLSTISDDGFHPHVSVGQWVSKEALLQQLADFNSQWTPFSFTISAISVITRHTNDSFSVIYNIPFGGTPQRVAQAPYCPSIPLSPTYKFHPITKKWEPLENGASVSPTILPSNTTACTSSSETRPSSTVTTTATSTTTSSTTAQDTTAPNRLRLVTYNVLFDLYDAELIYTTDRIPAELLLLKNTNADIIGLQEVTPNFLRNLLEQDWVRQNYYVSDSPASATIPSYSQVLLSKFPFSTSIQRHSLFKRTLVGDFNIFGRILRVSVVHLTSDYQLKKESGVNVKQRRNEQLNIVFNNTPGNYNDMIVMGDFNFGEREGLDAIDTKFFDVWQAVCPQDPGFTFDPSLNPTACLTSVKPLPARFDRILVHSLPSSGNSASTNNYHWIAKSCSMFGKEACLTLFNGNEIFPSDHFGVIGDLELVKASGDNLTLSNHLSLEQYLQLAKVSETAEGASKRESAMAILQQCSQKSDPPVQLLVIGSCLLGVQGQDTDIDCVCVGEVPKELFLTRFVETLVVNPNIQNVKLIADALIPVIRMRVLGFQVEMQYAHVPGAAGINFNTVNPASISCDSTSQLCLNAYFDTLFLLKSISDKGLFSSVLRAVRLWAKVRGLYSNRLGFLGGFAWSLLTARICQVSPNDDAEKVFAKFFTLYSSWNFAATPVTMIGTSISPKNTPGEFIHVMTPTKPSVNVCRNSTKSNTTILVEEFQRAKDTVRLVPWHEFFQPWNPDHEFYVQITLAAGSRAELISWVGRVESRIVSLVKQLEQAAPDLIVHPLTTRYHSQIDPDACLYLIGLRRTKKGASIESLDLLPAIQKFEYEMARDGGGWAEKSITMSILAKLLPKAESAIVRFPRLFLDSELHDYDAENDSSYCDRQRGLKADSHEAHERRQPRGKTPPSRKGKAAATSAVPVATAAVPSPKNSAATATTAATATKATKVSGTKSKGAAPPPEKKKLRTSEDVFNRIKWDPTFNLNEFTMCYEDRFLGLMEVPVNEFDMENIPFHRVWLFKRNGEIVWDREKRIDVLFS